MDELRRLAQDPSTSAAKLHELAGAHQHLWPDIARHPNAYPELISWIRAQNDPRVEAALANQSGSAATGGTAGTAGSGSTAPTAATGPTGGEAATTALPGAAGYGVERQSISQKFDSDGDKTAVHPQGHQQQFSPYQEYGPAPGYGAAAGGAAAGAGAAGSAYGSGSGHVPSDRFPHSQSAEQSGTWDPFPSSPSADPHGGGYGGTGGPYGPQYAQDDPQGDNSRLPIYVLAGILAVALVAGVIYLAFGRGDNDADNGDPITEITGTVTGTEVPTESQTLPTSGSTDTATDVTDEPSDPTESVVSLEPTTTEAEPTETEDGGETTEEQTSRSPRPTSTDDDSDDTTTSGVSLPNGNNDLQPNDPAFRNGIEPAINLSGYIVVAAGDNGRLIAISDGSVVRGIDTRNGEELWGTQVRNIDLETHPTGNIVDGKLVAGNQLVDLQSGEITEIDGVNDGALFCGVTKDGRVVYADGQDLKAFNAAGQEEWTSVIEFTREADSAADARVPATRCVTFPDVTRLYHDGPPARSVETYRNSDGVNTDLAGLEGDYDRSIFFEDGYVFMKPGESDIYAHTTGGERLAEVSYSTTRQPPRLYGDVDGAGSIHQYADLLGVEGLGETGLFIVDGNELVGIGLVNNSGLVDRISLPGSGETIELRAPIVTNTRGHTVSLTEDGSTLIVSPEATPAGEQGYPGYVAAYDMSSGDELWSYDLTAYEQARFSGGLLWITNPDTGGTTVYRPQQ